MSRWARRDMLALMGALAGMDQAGRARALAGLSAPERRALADEWAWQTHGAQVEPKLAEDGRPWRVWAIVAGRGFGKTRSGSEWVWARAREAPGARIALVAGSREEARRVMVEGESGLLGCARAGEEPRWLASRGELHFPSGATAFAYAACQPEALRGPQHDFAWADEAAKWPRGRGEAAWDNLLLGLRLGERPRAMVTTTPRPVPLLRRILAMDGLAFGRGRTAENPHLSRDFAASMAGLYAGTRLGRQELEGEMLEEAPGALWTRDMLEAGRVPAMAPGDARLKRVLVGVDPPASAQGDACGICVCGMDGNGTGLVLADLSARGLRPEGWAARVAAAAELWRAAAVVAEKNQGGEMVESVLKAAGCPVPVRPVHASVGKAARGEPVALRFESRAARLAGVFPELEDQLCGIGYEGYFGPGASPDRADAMVWAMSELFRPARAEPRVVLL